MLKTKITKAEYDALDAAIKVFYKLDGETALLQSDDAVELRTAKERAVTEANDAKATAARLQKEKDDAEKARLAAETAATEEKARKAGDITTLETSWQAKLDAAVSAERQRGDKLETQLKGLLVTNEAIKLANDISVSPSLLIPIIEKRLNADLTGDKPITRVLDANGGPSAHNLDDLRKELVANKEFAAIIKGSNASGGGTNQQQHGGGAPSGDKKIKDMTEVERVTLARADPAAYRQRAAAEGLQVRG